jgi:hypothetical protein
MSNHMFFQSRSAEACMWKGQSHSPSERARPWQCCSCSLLYSTSTLHFPSMQLDIWHTCGWTLPQIVTLHEYCGKSLLHNSSRKHAVSPTIRRSGCNYSRYQFANHKQRKNGLSFLPGDEMDRSISGVA